MTAEERLEEWARNLHYPAWEIPSPPSTLQRLVDEGRDERLKKRNRRLALEKRLARRKRGFDNMVPCKETVGVRMEIVTTDGDSVACPPDGGLGRMVERMAGAIDKSNRCCEVRDLLEVMPADLRALVDVTYRNCASPRDVPRSPEASANMLGCSVRTFFRRKAEVLEWLDAQLYPGVRRAA